MTKDCAICIWERIEVTKATDVSNPILLEQERASCDGKRIYIGDSAKWAIKPPRLSQIKFDGDDAKPSSVILTVVTVEINVRLIYVHNDSQWQKFLKRLKGFVNLSGIHLQLSSLPKTNFESGKIRTAKLDTGEFLKSTGNSRFSPNRPGRKQKANQQQTSPRRTVRPRRTFGKKPRLSPTKSPAQWSDHESDDLIVHPSPVKSSKIQDKTLYHSDDDQVHVKTEDDDKVVVHSEDEEEDEMLFDDRPAGKTKRKAIDDSDDDRDSFVKDMPGKTVQSGATTTPPRTQEAAAKSQSSQLQIKTFFTQQPASSVSSFDPIKRADKVTTPFRVSTNSVKKSKYESSGAWLHHSNAASSSPMKERKHMLFGSHSKGGMESTRDDDPVEEYPSPSPKRNPLEFLEQADNDPLQKRLDFRRATTTGLGHKRRRHISDHFKTPPRRLSLDDASTKVEEKSLVPQNPWRGLRNLGNTCYLNSSIQMLVTLVGTMTGESNWWDGLRGKGGPLTRSLIAIVDDLVVLPEAGFSSVVNPRQVKQAIDVITDKFAGFEQRDAHEFLSDLIDSVHEELDKDSKAARGIGGSSGVSPKGASSPITNTLANPASPDATNSKSDPVEKSSLPTDDFRLTVEVCLCCESCGYERKKNEIYRHLSVDILTDDGNSKGSIPNGLNHFFKPEVLEIRCEKCAHGSHAKRSLRVLSSPRYLLLHLKRFIFVERPIPKGNENAPPNSPSSRPEVEYVFKKNKAAVELTESLSLGAFCTDPAPRGYKLRGLVHHIGSRASSGHYTADSLRPYRAIPKETDTADVQAASASSSVSTVTATTECGSPAVTKSSPPEEEWITFDDGNSCKTSLETIQRSNFKQQNAYMLLYSLED